MKTNRLCDTLWALLTQQPGVFTVWVRTHSGIGSQSRALALKAEANVTQSEQVECSKKGEKQHLVVQKHTTRPCFSQAPALLS